MAGDWMDPATCRQVPTSVENRISDVQPLASHFIHWVNIFIISDSANIRYQKHACGQDSETFESTPDPHNMHP
jgi:hypothetical protein